MTEWNTEELIEPDKRFIWHPFTDMREWCSPEHESLVLVEGRGALLRDSRGREYIDRNSSIWTNIHGHNHPHIMTGSGRTGRMFASEHKGMIPDIQVLGKGLTGRYLPLAITLISEKLVSAFDGSVADGKALAYGHGYTGNALGCAAAKASLEVFENDRVLGALEPKIRYLSSALAGLKEVPGVSEVRQCGFIAGIETSRAEMAVATCIEARRHGLLTRPIWNVVVLMPPLCITMAQLMKAVETLRTSIIEVWRWTNSSGRKDAEEITA